MRGLGRIMSVAAALAGPVSATEADIIIVTGERSARSLQATSSSVAVVTADIIEQQAAPDRVEQLLAFIPNLQLGAGDQGPSIRGQETTGVLQGADAFLGGTRPRATLQVDGRALSYNEFIYGLASVWDVGSVEVFRSPQTTTQGRNSIAGAIFINTNDPTYDWQARARVLGGNYDTWQGSAALSGPIVGDELAFRVAGDVRRSRSWVDGVDTVDGASPADDDYSLLRAKLLAEPAALSGARLELTYVHLESQGAQAQAIFAPFRDRRDPVGGGGVFATNVDSITGVLDYKPTTALALTATIAHGQSDITRFAPTGGGDARVGANDTSIEAIIKWRPEGQLQGLVGVYHYRAVQDEFIDLSAFLGIGNFSDRQTSLGLFGEATWRPAARLGLTAGLRYQRDRQDRDGFLGTEAFGFVVDYDRRFEAWLPKFSAAYDITDDTSAGVLVQRAFNPGGTTISFETGLQDSFDAETLWNYEAFVRTSFADGAVTLGANVFYNDFTDAQRPQTTVITRPDGTPAFQTEIANAPAAESYGAEVELGWKVTSRLSLRGALGLLETRIVTTIDPVDPIAGKDFQRAPGVTASAGADWRPIDPLRLSAQIRHNSAYFSDDANSAALRIGAATIVDARAAWTMGPVTGFAYARNLFDRFTLTQLYSPDFGTANDPCQFGFGLEAKF